jgi:hypothetical protein
VCVSVCLCVCVSVRLYVSTVLNGSSPSLEETLLRVMTRSVGYILCVCTQRARLRVQCARINRVRMLHEPIIASGSFIVTGTEQSCLLQTVEQILSKFAGNVLLLTISVKDYILFMFTHRARAWVLNARVCVHSLIFERIMSTFAGNILRLTISGKDYVLFIVTHRVYACKRASASACVITH